MTDEQRFLKECGYTDYMNYRFMGIESSSFGEKSVLTGNEVVQAHFQRISDGYDIYLAIRKLAPGDTPRASGFYVVDGKISKEIVKLLV